MITTAPRINLLAKRKARYDKQTALAERAKKTSAIVLGVYLLVTIVVVGANYYFGSRVDEIDADLSKIKLSLSTKSVTLAQYEQITNRSEIVQKLIDKRREVTKLWLKLNSILPEGAELRDFSMEEDTVTFLISAPHVLLANQSMEALEQNFSDIGAKSSTMQIARSEDATYRLSLDISLDKVTKGGNDE